MEAEVEAQVEAQMEAQAKVEPLKTQRMQGVVPHGVKPGDALAVITATGGRIRASVPDGATAGQPFYFDVPIPPAVARSVATSITTSMDAARGVVQRLHSAAANGAAANGGEVNHGEVGGGGEAVPTGAIHVPLPPAAASEATVLAPPGYASSFFAEAAGDAPRVYDVDAVVEVTSSCAVVGEGNGVAYAGLMEVEMIDELD